MEKKIVIVNSNIELIEILEIFFKQEGYKTWTLQTKDIKEGKINFDRYIKEKDPDVILYDVAIPYEENWNLLKKIKLYKNVFTKRFVITTTNKRVLEELIGKTLPAYELVGKPFDLKEILSAARGK